MLESDKLTKNTRYHNITGFGRLGLNLATFDKIKNGENSSESVEIEEFANFLQSRNLASISLILLDVFAPFERFSKVLVPVFEPLASVLFGENFAKKIDAFSMREKPFDALKEAIARGRR